MLREYNICYIEFKTYLRRPISYYMSSFVNCSIWNCNFISTIFRCTSICSWFSASRIPWIETRVAVLVVAFVVFKWVISTKRKAVFLWCIWKPALAYRCNQCNRYHYPWQQRWPIRQRAIRLSCNQRALQRFRHLNL